MPSNHSPFHFEHLIIGYVEPFAFDNIAKDRFIVLFTIFEHLIRFKIVAYGEITYIISEHIAFIYDSKIVFVARVILALPEYRAITFVTNNSFFPVCNFHHFFDIYLKQETFFFVICFLLESLARNPL